MLRRFAMVLVAAIAFLTSFGPALAVRRVALVIGNSAYQAVARLPNPQSDAAAFAQMLRDTHFDIVDLRTDVTLDAFKQALRDFSSKVSDSDVAVFYYAGHGLEVGGNNLLVPIDAHLKSDLDAEDETVTLDRVLRVLEPARSLRLVILDACRENPFLPAMRRASTSRGVARGLQRVEATQADTMIAYATEPGAVADDGDGQNSPFTKSLVDNIAVPGLDLRIALGRVRDQVLKDTGGRQRPFATGSLGGANEALVDAPATAPDVQVAAAIRPPVVQDSVETDFNDAQTTNTVPAWEAFLRLHPQGSLAARAHDKIAMLQPDPVPLLRSGFSYVVGELDPNGDNFLALRAGPSGSAPLLRKLDPGTALAITGRRAPWLRVATADGDNGWVFDRFVRPNPGVASSPPGPGERFGVVTGLDPAGDNFLALKAAPDGRAERLAKLGPGMRLAILGRSGEWFRVRLDNGLIGWASARYVGCCAR